jgi:protein-tyrosine phosphatase
LYVKGIDVELKMSAEYRLVPETWPEVLEKNWIMPIEDKYILTELPISKPEELGWVKPLEEFKKLVSLGLTPILPHPERYFYLSHRDLMSYVDAGVVIQCNYGSFAGLYGNTAQQNAENLVNEGIVSLYGTDMHNLHYVKVIGDWFASGHPIAEY